MKFAVASRRLLVSVLALVALALATGANAAIITSADGQGRRITFDVRAVADTEWYASILRAIPHGNEISNVTIRIVPDQSIDTSCGSSGVRR